MRSQRADLAAAAREARKEPDAPDEREEGTDSAREASLERLREAELVVNDFRLQVRTELRLAAARGQVSAHTVTRLREALRAVREGLREQPGDEGAAHQPA
jgi:hypothetical protein